MFGVNWKQYMKNCEELRMHKKGKHKTGVDAISSLQTYCILDIFYDETSLAGCLVINN